MPTRSRTVATKVSWRAPLFHGLLIVQVILTIFTNSAWAEEVSPQPYEASIVTMGTVGKVQLWGLPDTAAQKVGQEIFGIWRDVDSTMSLYKPSSDLVRLNENAGKAAVSVATSLIDILQKAEEFRAKTNGIFDVRVGALMDLWGLGVMRREMLPTEQAIEKARALAAQNPLRVDAAVGQAQILDAGVKIDLGGIAKGYALDKACEVLRKRNVQTAILDLGGQLMMVNPPAEGWTIGIREPGNNAHVFKTLTIRRTCSVSTSSQAERFRKHGPVRIGHIIDPRTGHPSSAEGSVTVIAPSATLADVLSTVFLIANPNETQSLLLRFPEAQVFCIIPDGHGGWR